MEVKSKELRVGQYFNVPNAEQSPFRIDTIEFAGKDYAKVAQVSNPDVHPLTWYLEDLEPIPITEKWATDLGFTLQEGTYHLQKCYVHKQAPTYQLLFNDENISLYYYYWKTSCISIFNNDPKFRFVHQLQNYFFALGVDLELKNYSKKINTKKMRTLTNYQKRFLLENFFVNEKYLNWKGIADHLLSFGNCIVAGTEKIWVGGIGNFIQTEEAKGAVGCTLYTFDLENFLSSEFFKEIKKDTVNTLNKQKAAIEKDCAELIAIDAPLV